MPGKSNRLKIILLILLVLLVGGIISIFAGYRFVSDAPTRIISAVSEKATMHINTLHQTATRNGKTEWLLDARSAQLADGGKTAVLEDLSVTFFLEDGSEVHMTADSGTLNTQTNNFQVNGHIVLTNKTYRLNTEKLQYHHKGRIILIDAPVTIQANRMQFAAQRMTYDMNTNRTTLEKQVSGEIHFEPVE